MDEKREGYQFVGWYIDKECTKRLNPGGVLPHSVTLYDKWIPIWYPIEYDVDGGIMSRRNPRYTCIESEELLLYPAFKKGVMFDGWYWKDELITSLPSGVHEPVVLEARYKECPTIHFETCGGGQFASCTTNENGLLINLKNPVRPGYTFDGWFWDSEYRWRYNLDEPIHESCTLYARWSVSEYKITYDVNGGITSRRNPKSYTYFSDTIHLLPATKVGYDFVGWYDIRNNPLNSIYEHSMGDKHLIAHYKKKGEMIDE